MSNARTTYALGWGTAVLSVLFLVWAIGALGIIGDGGRPDRMYAAVLGVAVLGTVLSRFRAAGMARAMAATAVTVLVVGGVALLLGHADDPGASVLEIVGLSGMYAALFGTSAWLFTRAAGAPRSVVSSTR